MEPQVSGFVDDIAAIAADGGVLGGDDGFDRLFADLFQNLVQTLVIEAGDLSTVGSGAFALFKHLRQA
jgi:ketosteroid isomerase-like protein